jgi:hypothetical protein
MMQTLGGQHRVQHDVYMTRFSSSLVYDLLPADTLADLSAFQKC